MGDLSQSYRTLELDGPVSQDELKRVYRDLVKVWHPDRFGQDEKLQQLAEKKLKEINGAYEILLPNLFAEAPAPSGAAPPFPPPPAPVVAVKRSLLWACWIIVLVLAA